MLGIVLAQDGAVVLGLLSRPKLWELREGSHPAALGVGVRILHVSGFVIVITCAIIIIYEFIIGRYNWGLLLLKVGKSKHASLISSLFIAI